MDGRDGPRRCRLAARAAANRCCPPRLARSRTNIDAAHPIRLEPADLYVAMAERAVAAGEGRVLMKIAMFTNTYLPHVGGVARSVSTYEDELRRRGHEVRVVAPTFEGAE